MTDKELIEHLAANNKNKYNLRKLLEECIELSEVVVKMINKTPENQPTIDKLVEEAGDVLFRLSVVSYEFNVYDQIEERREEKAQQIKQWVEGLEYVGGQ